MPSKPDPLTQLTDEELYAPHLFCELPLNAFGYWPHEERPKALEDEMPICCRKEARAAQKPVTEVARVLNEAGIGCVLWAGTMHGVYGFYMTSDDIDFVVADSLIDRAVEVLLAAPPIEPDWSVRHCPGEEECSLRLHDPYYHGRSRSRRTSAPAPSVHLHRSHRHCGTIRLWKQSSTLWALRPLTETPIPGPGSQSEIGKLALALGPDYTVASHPRFTEYRTIRAAKNEDLYGRYPADLHPVVIMLPERGFETELRLYARYPPCRTDMHLEFIIERWLFQLKVGNEDVVDVDQMNLEFKVIVKIALEGNVTMRQIRVALRELLGEPAHDDGLTMNPHEDHLLLDRQAWCLDRDDPELSTKMTGKWNPWAPRWGSKGKKQGNGEGKS